jgi:hypothetical protein
MARQLIFGWRPRSEAEEAIAASVIETGTKMFFQQTNAPTGWTKDTTHDDKALRIVSGSVSSGGATAFSSVMGSGKTTGSHVLLTSEIPSHNHGVGTLATASNGAHTHNLVADSQPAGSGVPSGRTLADSSAGTSIYITTSANPVNLHSQSISSSGAHTHTLSGSVASAGSDGGHTHTLSLDLQYVDCIIAEKD